MAFFIPKSPLLFVDAHRRARQFNGGIGGEFGLLQIALHGENAVFGVDLLVLQLQLQIVGARAGEPAVVLQQVRQIVPYQIQGQPSGRVLK